MALSALIQWDCRTTGADTNGGGFKAGASGTDWSQQNAAQYSVTDGVAAGTTTITSATANFGTDVVGNVMYVQGGTGSITAGWYEITARTNSTTITVDRSTGLTTGTGVTLNIGGSFATPAAMLARQSGTSGQHMHLKNGAYSTAALLTMTTNSGGVSNNQVTTFNGYDTAHWDRPKAGTRPVISCTAAATDGFSLDTNCHLCNVVLNGTSTARTGVIATVAYGSTASGGTATAIWCTVTGFSEMGFACPTEYCHVYAMKTSSTVGFWGDYIHSYSGANANPCPGFGDSDGFGNGIRMDRCVSAYNTGATGHGVAGRNLYRWRISNSVFVGNAGDGIRSDGYATINLLVNSISAYNTGKGVNSQVDNQGISQPQIDYNAIYNNTAGAITGIVAGTHDVTLTADPFVNKAGASAATDLETLFACFALNTTAGGGAVLRAAGYPTYLDIGAVQHADSAATPVGHLNDAAANDALTALQSVFPATAVLDIYDAAAPADPDTAHSGTILVSVTLPGTPWGSPSAGVMAKNGTWSGTAGNTGTPVSARLRNAADSKRLDFTCTGTGGGGEVTLDTASITSGNTVTISTFTLTPA